MAKTKTKTQVFEIERKFLVDTFPAGIKLDIDRIIYQHYIVTGDEEIRIRKIVLKKGCKFTMTLKKGTGLKREEYKWEIGEDTYKSMMERAPGKPLEKYRGNFKIGKVEYEVDIFKDKETGEELKIIEVEFPSVKKAKEFEPPKWFGREVTEEEEFSNQGMWKALQEERKVPALTSL